tara:strand:- start:106 stop:1530 length:1425 start_codon:yes stop_codon:yes gene_type:complete
MGRFAPAFLRTTAFRVTLLSAGLLAASSLVILTFVYFASVGVSLSRTDAAVEDEVATVEARFRDGGIQSVNRYILQRSVGGSDFLYLLVHPTGRRISGNLSGLPDAVADDDGRLQFQYMRPPAGGEAESEKDERLARGRIAPLPSGYQIFVGMDVEDEDRLIGGMLRAVLAASALALALGVASGVFISRRFATRLDQINRVARAVEGGDLRRRAPRNHTGDELDELAANFNAMLDRIEELMARMKNAGDSIAHDLRSPLTRMRNRLDDALREEGDLEAREASLSQAVSDADELLGVFNAILSISRLEAGERRQSFSRLDPAVIVEDLCELYEPVCEESGLRFAAEMEPGLEVRGDRGLLSQALANLLDNAVKYTPDGGAITLRLRKCASGEIEMSVTDTGPGIPPADRLRATQRFVRLDQSRTKPGSGLGLSLVKAIADIHGAQLELSDGPGVLDGHGPGLRAALVLPAVKQVA